MSQRRRQPMRLGFIVLVLMLLLLSPSWAESSTEALVQALVASPQEKWDTLLNAHQGPFETDCLKPLLQKAAQLPLEQARKTAQACDAVAYRANGSKSYEGLAQLGLARSLLRDGHKREAVEVATALAAAHPELAAAQLMSGLCLLETAQYEPARQVFEQLTKTNPFFEVAWLELGRTNVFLNRRGEALTAFQHALSINPQNGVARDAVASLSGATPATRIKTSPEARAHFEKAEQLFGERKFTEAIAEYRLSAQADPRFAKPLVYVGDCYYQLGDLEQAIASYQAALAVDPKDKQAHRFLGDMYERKFDRTGESSWLDQAIECYRAALQSDPGYGAAQADLQRAQGKKTR